MALSPHVPTPLPDADMLGRELDSLYTPDGKTVERIESHPIKKQRIGDAWYELRQVDPGDGTTIMQTKVTYDQVKTGCPRTKVVVGDPANLLGAEQTPPAVRAPSPSAQALPGPQPAKKPRAKFQPSDDVDDDATLSVELNGTTYVLTSKFGAPKPASESLLKDFEAIGEKYLDFFGHEMPPPDKTDAQKARCENNTVETIKVGNTEHAVSPTYGMPLARTFGMLAPNGIRVCFRIVKPGKAPRAAWDAAVADSGKLCLEEMNDKYVVHAGVEQRDVTEADMRMLRSMGAQRIKEQKLYAEVRRSICLYGHTPPPPATSAHLRLYWMFDSGEVFVAHKVAEGAEPMWWSYTEPQRSARQRKATKETAADEQGHRLRRPPT